MDFCSSMFITIDVDFFSWCMKRDMLFLQIKRAWLHSQFFSFLFLNSYQKNPALMPTLADFEDISAIERKTPNSTKLMQIIPQLVSLKGLLEDVGCKYLCSALNMNYFRTEYCSYSLAFKDRRNAIIRQLTRNWKSYLAWCLWGNNIYIAFYLVYLDLLKIPEKLLLILND